MGRWWPLLLLLLVPALWFPGALPGPRVVSADDHLSVHHLFQQADGGGSVRHPHLSDPALQFKALQRRTVEALRRGEAPLWNPDLYGGAPLLADAQSRAASPVTLLRLVLPEDAAQDAGVAWTLLWLGLGTALLAGALGLGPWAALAAGAAAMLGPYPSVWLLHPHATTFCWLPWLLWAIETRRGWAIALAVAGMATGGHPGTLTHGLGVGAAWWVARSRGPGVALCMGVGLLLAAPLLLPLLELAGRSETAQARVAVPLAPRQLLDLVWPGALGHPSTDTWHGPGSWADGQLHPGLATLALALWGARDRLGRGLLLGWAAMVALSLLPLPGPVAHGRLGSEAAWLLALGAGVGVRRLAGDRALRGAALTAAVVATGLWARRHDQGSLPAADHDPAPAPWVTELRAAACDDGPCARVLGLGWAAQPNTLSLVGLGDLRGYDLPVSTDTRRLMVALRPRPRGPWFPVDDLPTLALLRFHGVGVVLTPPDRSLDLEPVPLRDAPVRAWRIPDPAPMAWLAVAPRPATDPKAALAQVAADPQAATRPPVEGVADRGSAGPARPLAAAWDGASRVALDLPDDATGVVVLNQSWAPGWRASIDGAPAPVLRAGGTRVAVAVQAGDRRLDLRYRPGGWVAGLQACAAGGLSWLVLLGAALRRRSIQSRRPERPT